MTQHGNWTRRQFMVATGAAVGAATAGEFSRKAALAGPVTTPDDRAARIGQAA